MRKWHLRSSIEFLEAPALCCTTLCPAKVINFPAHILTLRRREFLSRSISRFSNFHGLKISMRGSKRRSIRNAAVGANTHVFLKDEPGELLVLVKFVIIQAVQNFFLQTERYSCNALGNSGFESRLSAMSATTISAKSSAVMSLWLRSHSNLSSYNFLFKLTKDQ